MKKNFINCLKAKLGDEDARFHLKKGFVTDKLEKPVTNKALS